MKVKDEEQIKSITDGVRDYLKSIGEEDLIAVVAHRLIEETEGVDIRVESAVELTAVEKKDVSQILRDKWNLHGQITFEVNKDLIGGMKVYWGDKVLDLSVAGKMEEVYAK